MIGALALCRLLHVGALMLLFGECAYVGTLVPAPLREESALRIRRRAVILAVVVAATGLGWLSFEAGQMGQGWTDSLNSDVLGDVLFGTAFGRVWQIHLLLVLGLMIAAAAMRRALWIPALLAGSALASLGFIGHAAILSGGLGWAQRLNHALHLLACGAWTGSLVPLLPLMRALDEPDHRADAALALRRYSQAGHWVVALVVGTGSADTALVLGRWPSFPLTPYEELMLAKLVLVAGMVVVALVNRYRLVPRMSTAPAASQAALRRNTLFETVLGGFVIVLSIGLSTLDPG